MWYELRWGITACLMLTVSLITVVFYYHPPQQCGPLQDNPLPEGGGRVEDVFVKAGEAWRLAIRCLVCWTPRRLRELTSLSQLDQIASAFAQAEVQLGAAKATLVQAESALAQSENELSKKQELSSRGQQLVSKIEIERLENTVAQRRGGVQAAKANITAVQTQISDVLPAQRKSAERQLEQAQVALDKTVVYAGVDGQVAQFALQRGDYVIPYYAPRVCSSPRTAPNPGGSR